MNDAPMNPDDVDGIPIDDVDGIPIKEEDKEDLDGVPIANTPLIKSAAISALLGYDDDDDEEDIDGAPCKMLRLWCFANFLGVTCVKIVIFC